MGFTKWILLAACVLFVVLPLLSRQNDETE
jgi:hypothetical protein